MRTLKTMLYCAAGATILFCASVATAAKRHAPSVRAIGLTELEMQVLLDRAGFSPGEIDDERGKNSREALAAFEAASGLAPGEPTHKEFLKALHAGAAKPIVSYEITAEDAAGPFIQTIPRDMTEKSKLPGRPPSRGSVLCPAEFAASHLHRSDAGPLAFLCWTPLRE